MHGVLTLSFICQGLQQEQILSLSIVLMQILPIRMFGGITYIATWKFPYSVMQSLRDRGCVCYTTGSITIWQMNTLTPSNFNSLKPVHNILHENLILHDLFYTLHPPPSKTYWGKGNATHESKPGWNTIMESESR